mmetsp:Transcript_22082/g.55359  ORF Transcript_22082/g.55359 Transcript_22082/m.55359 type:complete len:209 (-) Transcript_22082:624-1250(-)
MDHKAPKERSMPATGGRCVTLLNTGTKSKPPTPTPKTRFWPRGLMLSSAGGTEMGSESLNLKASIPTATAVQTMEGRKTFATRGATVTCPPIQSMVVVTSPIGLQAPPALAAITTIPPSVMRVSRSESATSLVRSEHMTMVVVRLSKTAERKKERPAVMTRSSCFDVVWILSVTMEKPLWASTVSTMLMAPTKKKTIWAISAKLSSRA